MAENAGTTICRICKSNQGSIFNASGYIWFKCGGCLSVQKQITEQEYHSIKPIHDSGHYLASKNEGEIEAFLEVSQKIGIISHLSSLYLRTPNKGNRKFLDVGCGMGGYMLAAKKLGFETIGFEPDTSHSNIAKQLLKLNVVDDCYSPERTKIGPYDFIMLSHVIEHIYKPQELINTLLAELKPGGILVIVTPNSNSILFAITGRSWVMLKDIDHVVRVSL